MKESITRTFHPLKHVEVLGLRIDVASPAELLDRGEELMASGKFHHVVTANALLLLEAQHNPRLREICKQSSLVIGESAGIEWACKTLHGEMLERMAGIDYAHRLCERAATRGFSVFLLGGNNEALAGAEWSLKKSVSFLEVSGTRTGFFDPAQDAEVIGEIKRSGARLVLVAMGMPKQELWIQQHAADLPPAVYIGVGGSFDVWSGKVDRAPAWLQSNGLEWLYRVSKEPWRWRRIMQLPKFAAKVMFSKWKR